MAQPLHARLASLCLLALCTTTGCRGEPPPTAPTPRAPRRAKKQSLPRNPGGLLGRTTAPQPPVVLELGQTTVSWSAGTLTVDCRVLLVNRTGRRLGVVTNFQSPFDGFTVIVRGPHGGLVVRQSYVAHQSPFAMNRTVTVVPGETSATLRFPSPWPPSPRAPLKCSSPAACSAPVIRKTSARTSS